MGRHSSILSSSSPLLFCLLLSPPLSSPPFPSFFPFSLSLLPYLCQDKLKYCHFLNMMIDAWIYFSFGRSWLYQPLISPSCFRCNCYIRSHLPCLFLYWRNRCGSAYFREKYCSIIEAERHGFVNWYTAKPSGELRNYIINFEKHWKIFWVIMDFKKDYLLI